MNALAIGPGFLLVVSGLLGLAIGSFLNVVVHRVPAGISIVSPASRCPRCDHPIRQRHNVPVISWILLGGRCADCRAAISLRYPMVETLTAVVFVALSARLLQLDLTPALPAFLCFSALGIALAAIDLDTGRLPDALVLPAYPVLATMLAGAALVSGDPAGLLRASIGAASSFGLFYAIALAKPGGMGFGDVKTAGLIGGMLGFVSYSVLLVGLFAGFFLGSVVGLAALSTRRAGRTSKLPFGPFLVTGALASLFLGSQIAQFYQALLLTR